MKKIAILAEGWNKYINYAWVSGCKRYILEHHCDIAIDVFNSFGSYSLDEKYNQGENNIFNLPNLKEYDGIIVELTNLLDAEVKRYLVDLVLASEKPAISLLEDIPELYFCGTNNYMAVKEMVNHLIEVHGCRQINFIGGTRENCENRARQKAYEDALTAHGIPVESERIYHHDFEIDTGEEGYAIFRERNLEVEAYVCANDNIAVGVMHAAEADGLSAPEDFLVTGYDNFDKASIYKPRITTAGFVREDIAYNAMDKMLEIWETGESARESLHMAECIFQESCGCRNPLPTNRGLYVNSSIMQINNERKVYNEILMLKRELLNSENFKEMARCIPKYIQELKYEAIYFLVNEEIADCSEVPTFDSVDMGDYRTVGYPGYMDVLLAWDNNHYLDVSGKSPGELIPGNPVIKPGDVHMFLPVHFRDREVGYMILKNCDYLLSQKIFEALNVIEESMETMYNHIILSGMNRELSRLYIRDSLTGMYNRMAYQKLAVPLYENCQKGKRPLMIMFVDLDRLKYINDNFGHDMGNIAIRAIATAINNCCPEDGIAMRYGGDEFVVMVPDYDEGRAQRMMNRLEREIAREREIHNTGFEISASMGYAITSESDDRNLNDFINLADERMYENKKAKKAQR